MDQTNILKSSADQLFFKQCANQQFQEVAGFVLASVCGCLSLIDLAISPIKQCDKPISNNSKILANSVEYLKYTNDINGLHKYA